MKMTMKQSSRQMKKEMRKRLQCIAGLILNLGSKKKGSAVFEEIAFYSSLRWLFYI